jgi:hypothetical protein
MTFTPSICVYCGSGAGANPRFTQSARDLGKAIAEAGLGLVYGGGNVGLMGIVAHTVLESGGRVTGIIPEFLKKRENMLEGVDELIITKDMHERKMLMFERSDAFVALPGGIGTLEELIEQLTWAQLGQHKKPIVMANIDDFWRPLVGLLAHMQEEEFLRPGLEPQYELINDVEAIVPHIRSVWAAEDVHAVPDETILRQF